MGTEILPSDSGIIKMNPWQATQHVLTHLAVGTVRAPLCAKRPECANKQDVGDPCQGTSETQPQRCNQKSNACCISQAGIKGLSMCGRELPSQQCRPCALWSSCGCVNTDGTLSCMRHLLQRVIPLAHLFAARTR